MPLWEYFGDPDADSIRFIFLSPRNIYNLFMQSALIATLAVGITVVLLLGDIDLSAAATAGVCAALLGVLVLAGVPGWIACIVVMGVGIVMGAAQGLLVAYIGIPSFVVTLAGLLGYQGLMQKILPTGNLNVGDPFVRSITRILIPELWSWALGAACILVFGFMVLRQQSQRKARNLEQDSNATTWGQIVFFAVLIVAAIATLNSYRSVPLLVVLLVGLTALVGWVTTSTPFGRAIFAAGGNAESARRVGMNVRRIRVAAFGIVGLLAAIGGVFGRLAFRLGVVHGLCRRFTSARVDRGRGHRRDVAVRRTRVGMERDSRSLGDRFFGQWSRSFRSKRRRQAYVFRRDTGPCCGN